MQAEINLPINDVAEGSKRTKKKRKSNVIDAQDLNAKKRTKGKGKGKVGKLEGLMSVPMDILFEILGHLRPLDILHLARTTKEFRQILLHKSSISVWKAARANVPDLPDCFPDMNEPEFVNLVFDQHCHECLAPNIRSVEWPLRVRLCPKCTKTTLVVLSWHMYLGANEEDICEDLVPTRETSRSRQVAFYRELDAVKAHWRTLESTGSREAYIKERRAYKMKIFEHAEICNGWFKSQQLDRSQELKQVRQARKNAIIEKLKDLGWGPELEKILPIDSIGNHKLVKQPNRLTERIWKNIQPEMVKYMDQMKVKRQERERKALIVTRKTPAIEVLRDYKKSQLPWTAPMPEPVDFCNFPAVKAILELPNEVTVDVSNFAEVVPLLPSLFSDWRAEIERQLLLRLRRQLQADQRRLRSESISDSYADMPRSAPCISEPAEGLLEEDPELAQKMLLATTVFKCQECRSFCGPTWIDSDIEEDEFSDLLDFFLGQSSDTSESLFFPQVMSHPCLTRRASFDFDLNDSDPSTYLAESFSCRAEWSCKSLKVDNRAGKMMEDIVRAYGKDPLTATVQDMDDLDAWLGCPHCAEWLDPNTNSAQLFVFRWRTALKHHSRCHYRKSVSWLRLSEAQATLTRAGQSNEGGGSLDGSDSSDLSATARRWSCTHCFDRSSETKPELFTHLKLHLKSNHQIDEPELNRDYHQAFDALDSNENNKDVVVNIPLLRSRKRFSSPDFL